MTRRTPFPAWVKLIALPWAAWISLAQIQTGKDVAVLKAAVLKVASSPPAPPARHDRTPVFARFGFPVPELVKKGLDASPNR
jgi:hypothetical protein